MLNCFLPWRFGAAGFAGIGEVFPGATQILRINHFLPAFGGGPRFELSNKYHVIFALTSLAARTAGLGVWALVKLFSRACSSPRGAGPRIGQYLPGPVKCDSCDNRLRLLLSSGVDDA